MLLVSISNVKPGIKLNVLSNVAPRTFGLTVVGKRMRRLAGLPNVNGGSTRQLILRLGSGVTGVARVSSRSPTAVRPVNITTGNTTKRTVRTLMSLKCLRQSMTSVMRSLSSNGHSMSRLVGIDLVRLKGKQWK